MKSAEVESRTQGSRPRTQKKSEAMDTPSEDRPSRCRRIKKDVTWKSSRKKKVFTQNVASSLACSSNAHDIGKFSASQKIVLSSSRRQGIFEDLQASRPRSRTSNCVLEDSTSGNHRALYHMVHIWRNVRVTYANRTLLLNIKFLAK